MATRDSIPAEDRQPAEFPATAAELRGPTPVSAAAAGRIDNAFERFYRSQGILIPESEEELDQAISDRKIFSELSKNGNYSAAYSEFISKVSGQSTEVITSYLYSDGTEDDAGTEPAQNVTPDRDNTSSKDGPAEHSIGLNRVDKEDQNADEGPGTGKNASAAARKPMSSEDARRVRESLRPLLEKYGVDVAFAKGKDQLTGLKSPTNAVSSKTTGHPGR